MGDEFGRNSFAFTPDEPPEWEPAEPAEGAEGDQYGRLVSFKVRAMRAERDARAILAREGAPAEPFDAGTLGTILARPPEPAARVQGLVPWQASALIVAQRKTGKTTLMLNLARSLLTGEPFLGSLPVRRLPAGARVAILNFEVSAAQLARWADEVGVPADGLFLVNLRGRRNPLDHPDDRAELAKLLRAHRVASLIVDPFGRAYAGASQNDAGEVGAWLVNLDRFARAEVGALDLVLTAHAGWNGERTRGSSALEDWADVIVTMTRDEDTGARFLRATGRDVDMDEDRLDFDPATRLLSLSGQGSRKDAGTARKDAETRAAILNLLGLDAHKLGLSGKALAATLGAKDADFTRVRNALVADGLLAAEERTGRGGGVLYRLTPEGAEHTEKVPNRPLTNLPNLPVMGAGSGSASSDPNMPNRAFRESEPDGGTLDAATAPERVSTVPRPLERGTGGQWPTVPGGQSGDSGGQSAGEDVEPSHGFTCADCGTPIPSGFVRCLPCRVHMTGGAA